MWEELEKIGINATGKTIKTTIKENQEMKTKGKVPSCLDSNVTSMTKIKHNNPIKDE